MVSVGTYVWSVEAMKNIFKTLIVFFAVLCAIPTWSCSQNIGSMTGGACSIKELNNLEKNKTEKVNFAKERNLRPVRLNPEITKLCDAYCVFGMNLQRILLEK